MTAVDQRREAFTGFVRAVEPRLHRALCVVRGPEDGREATAEALAWAWEHWDQVVAMENPAGYLYRVGCSRTRPRASRPLERVEPHHDRLTFDPRLGPALEALSPRQRDVLLLVHGCDWTHQEAADALDLSRSSVATHLARGLDRLRRALGVDADG